jgi:hypothetical protein
MTKNRRQQRTARYIQNVYDVPYSVALSTVRGLHSEAYARSKVNDRPYLDVLEKMAGEALGPDLQTPVCTRYAPRR